MIKEIYYNSGNRKLNVFFVIVFVIIFVLAQLSLALNSFSLYVLVPSVFIYSLIQNPKLFWNYKPLLYFLLLILVSAVSFTKSLYMDDSLRELKTLAGSFGLCFIITQFSIKNRRYIFFFYILYILLFLVVIYRGYIEGLTYTTTERFSTEKLNANFFGYVGFCAIVSSFFVWQIASSYKTNIRSYKNNYLILFSITSILSLIANIYAASRAGTTISLITIILLVSTKYLLSFSFKTVINMFYLSLLGLLVFISINKIYKGSNLQERLTNQTIQEDSRSLLLADAYKVGLKNPLLGVGPANFKHYSYNGGFSHSTYFEIFANNGIVAFILFIAVLLPFLRNIWKYKPQGEDQTKIRSYFLIFMLLFVAYNFFYVFHTSPFLISFYYLVLIHSFFSLKDNQLKVRDNKLAVKSAWLLLKNK